MTAGLRHATGFKRWIGFISPLALIRYDLGPVSTSGQQRLRVGHKNVFVDRKCRLWILGRGLSSWVNAFPSCGQRHRLLYRDAVCLAELFDSVVCDLYIQRVSFVAGS